jgi:2-C-methyl-D-erythritol 4-phosphate cytidylyltransferase
MDVIDLVVPAAGIGARVGKNTPKQFLMLGGVPVMIHPLRLFATIPWIGRKIIVHAPGTQDRMTEVLDQYGLSGWHLVPGGATRQESMRLGLAAVQTSRVISHNAVVPFVTRALVEQVARFDEDCVTTASPVQENMVKGGSIAEAAVNRADLKVVVTPVCFRTEALRECHERARQEGVVVNSDIELMLHYGRSTRLVPGHYRNFKITTLLDLALAEFLLANPDWESD